MFELAVPIRLYWDLSPMEEMVVPACSEVCRDMLSLKILSLNLTDTGCAVSPACLGILEALHGKGIAITLVLSPQSCTYSLLDWVRTLGIRTILIHASSLAELDPYRHLIPEVGVSFQVTRSNWRELPALLSFCHDSNAHALSLPMQRLWSGATPFFMEREEKRQLVEMLQSSALPSGLKITIHDPFMWKLFYPTVPFPDGGCQAANTMVAISPSGDVYPCPTLPISIGNVTSHSFREIVTSSAKKELRRDILRHPGACAGCVDLPSCKGGCRGRAYAVNGSLDSADPGCLA